MSDPIFLRSMMSSSVYAEQMHSAQLQGQQAAKERAARLRQEQIRDEQAAVQQMVEAGKTDIKERQEGHGGGAEENLEQEEEAVQARNDASESETLADQSHKEVHHIDLTV